MQPGQSEAELKVPERHPVKIGFSLADHSTMVTMKTKRNAAGLNLLDGKGHGRGGRCGTREDACKVV